MDDVHAFCCKNFADLHAECAVEGNEFDERVNFLNAGFVFDFDFFGVEVCRRKAEGESECGSFVGRTGCRNGTSM